MEAAANLVANAKYPVILSGGGVSQVNALEEVKALAEFLTAPVVNSYLHNDSFPAGHQLSVGPIGYCGSKAAMRTIAKADVVLALGCRLGPFGTLPQYEINYWPMEAKIIQVDINPAVLGVSRKVDVASPADCKEFARELLVLLKARSPGLQPNLERLADIEKEKMEWTDELARWSGSTSRLMHPRRFLSELSKAIPEGSIIATDIGNNSSMANAYFKFSGVRQHISALTWGNCGFAFGAALGATDRLP